MSYAKFHCRAMQHLLAGNGPDLQELQLQEWGALTAAEAGSCPLLLLKLHWQHPYIHVTA